PLAGRHGPVDVVTPPAAAPLLETHPAVRRVISFDKKGRGRGLGGLFRLARTLRAERYEWAYLPHRSLRTALAAWLARVPRRVGFADGWRWLYTDVRPRPKTGHEVDRLLVLAGPALTGGAMTLTTTAEDRAATEAFLGAHGVEAPFVALAPGSIWGSKRWPYYRELGQRLAGRVGIVVVGGPEDAGLGEEVVRAVEGGGGRWRAVNGCGKLTLRQSAEVIRRAAVLVTNDRAPLHFAQAWGTPTFSEQGADAVLTRIVKLTRASMATARGKEIAGVGIGSPGPLDTKTGVVLLTPNLGWTNFPLRDRLTQALGLPAALDNDANCAIFGEWWRGAARGADHVVGLTIGTGIGGGIVLGGEVYRGAADIA